MLLKQRAAIERFDVGNQKRNTNIPSLYNDTTGSVTSDPSSNTLSAFFDSRSDAESAISRLKDAGTAENAIRFMPGSEVDDAVAGDRERFGFWTGLADWFFPDENRATYAEGLSRGGFLGAEQEQAENDGMEGSRSAGARMASVRMDKPGAFKWKRSLLLASI